ncbi:hypothetical protein [Parerythrobacter lacustris]|uniref:Uncharacterized protein n=1 Tax=Parerythrobacter lacustris TaxID=2969984 RepID=A0ABT1XNP6_9SPHN|nr:hypothetical protein [Parerythrobacter lacustris]MCR2833283.1 hypothetical protein [Parerythrobacter lacustris]
MAGASAQVRARRAHRRVAVFLGLFLVLHFAAHFAALDSRQLQEWVLHAGRAVYRIPAVEAALVAGFAAQITLGIGLVRGIAARKRKDGWHYAQLLSGCYLAAFIIMHTGAALLTRWLSGLDTSFYWAAGTLTLSPLKFGFAPYYALAVTALGTHLVAALHFRLPRRWHAPALAGGPVAALAIILAYSGALYPVELPGEYLAYFGSYLAVKE